MKGKRYKTVSLIPTFESVTFVSNFLIEFFEFIVCPLSTNTCNFYFILILSLYDINVGDSMYVKQIR